MQPRLILVTLGVAWNPFLPLDEQGHMFLPDIQT